MAIPRHRTVVFALLSGFLTLVAVPACHAQEREQEENPPAKWFIGPSLLLSQVYEVGELAVGWSSSPRFSLSGGAFGRYQVSEGMGFDLEVGYDSRGLYLSDSSGSRRITNATFKYISFRPSVDLGAFLLGFGIGIPLGNSSENSDAVTTQTVSNGPETMNLLVEARLGLAIPAIHSDVGELRVLLGGTYGFTKITKPANGETNFSVNNGPLASIGVGVVYLFEL